MSSITLPKKSYEALQDLIHLDDAFFTALLKALLTAKPILSARKFCSQIGAAFEKPDQEKIKRIVDELLTIAVTRDSTDGSPEEIAEIVSNAVRDGDAEEFSISDEDEKILRERITKVFSETPILGLITKAQDVLTEHQHVFYSARIFTDVRPVFAESGDTVDAVGLVHNLAIHYGKGTDHDDFYVALDTMDIQALRKALDRAEMKEKALRALIQQTRVSYLE